jgi:hypothetical protein
LSHPADRIYVEKILSGDCPWQQKNHLAPTNRREWTITGRAYATETGESSVACRNDIHHCGEQDDKPDKIDERNEENVVWLAGEPRMIIAHICLLSPRLGLGRQNFIHVEFIRA